MSPCLLYTEKALLLLRWWRPRLVSRTSIRIDVDGPAGYGENKERKFCMILSERGSVDSGGETCDWAGLVRTTSLETAVETAPASSRRTPFMFLFPWPSRRPFTSSRREMHRAGNPSSPAIVKKEYIFSRRESHGINNHKLKYFKVVFPGLHSVSTVFTAPVPFRTEIDGCVNFCSVGSISVLSC